LAKNWPEKYQISDKLMLWIFHFLLHNTNTRHFWITIFFFLVSFGKTQRDKNASKNAYLPSTSLIIHAQSQRSIKA
jgi:hypothetical protein